MNTSAFPKVMTIAGSDSSGGAGIQADLKTFAALKCYGTSVVTALTAQNTKEVEAIIPTSSRFVCRQIQSILGDIGSEAIKIGMLFNRSIIKAVLEATHRTQIPIVLDPVLTSTSGYPLLRPKAISELVKLFPLTTIVTPNIPEAALLAKIRIVSKDSLIQAGKIIIDLGASAVVIKGGHFSNSDKGADCLFIKTPQGALRTEWIETPYIETLNTHGSGCTYSSAIGSFLAHSMSLEDAVYHAKQYVHGAIKSSVDLQIGTGSGPLHHFYQWWN